MSDSYSPLPGLLVTSSETIAFKAARDEKSDTIILKHPNPHAFEQAALANCIDNNAAPDVVKFAGVKYSDWKKKISTKPKLADASIHKLFQVVPPAMLKSKLQYEWVQLAFDLMKRLNPEATKLFATSRGAMPQVTEDPLEGFHVDGQEATVDRNIPQWRIVMTLSGRGTEIIPRQLVEAAEAEILKVKNKINETFPVPELPEQHYDETEASYKIRKQLALSANAEAMRSEIMPARVAMADSLYPKWIPRRLKKRIFAAAPGDIVLLRLAPHDSQLKHRRGSKRPGERRVAIVFNACKQD